MDSFGKYLELIAKVDDFTERAQVAYPGHIACGPGCNDCCNTTFTIFAVEAHHLGLGFDALTPDLKERLAGRCRSQKPSSPCPLLEEGLCALYPFRPIICRTHGFPFTSSQLRLGRQSVTSFCDKNFTGMPGLTGLSREHVLNLDLLNSTLAALNHLFLKEYGEGLSRPERVWLPDTLLR